MRDLERTVDLAAVARVAARVELKHVRLTEISAKCDPNAPGPSLEPSVDLACRLGEHDGSNLEVICHCKFVAQSKQLQAIESGITYLLLYEISGSGSPSVDDLAEFARTNGALHSWPFLRELLYGLTSRMGYPPYTLPVMHFKTAGESTATAQNTESVPVGEEVETPKTTE